MDPSTTTKNRDTSPTTRQQSSVAGGGGVPPPDIPEDLLRHDASNQDTLRATNNSRTRSNISDLGGLFVPPPPPPSVAAAKQPPEQVPPVNSADPPPLPSETPAMRSLEGTGEQGQQQQQHGHRRMPSTIRFAANHERQVSWGLDMSDRNLLQPSLQDAKVTSNLMSQFQRHRGGSGRISLDDLQNTRPMENEAEAYLIKALETMDFQSERKMAEVGPVLSNVPKEDLDALRVEPDASLLTSPGQSKESLQQTVDGGGSNAGATGSTRRPPSTASRRPPPKPSRGHRRNETVGDQLESLAAAMDLVHTQHLDLLVHHDDHSDSLLPASLQNKIETAAVPCGLTSADALQQNANLIYNRHRTQMEDRKDEELGEGLLASVNSDASSVSTAASKRWKLLKNSLAATRSPHAESPSKDGRHDDALRIEEEPEVLTSSDDVIQSSENEDASDQNKNKPEGKNPTSSFNVRSSKNKFVTELEEFFAPRRKTINHFLRTVIFVVILPSLGISAFLFYLSGNPPTGRIDLQANTTDLISKRGRPIDPEAASASWWLLFLGVRQVVTFVLAKAIELFFIDFLSVRSKFSVRVVGPWVTLFILQTKGWPFLVFVWGLFNFALLSGTKPFFHHWGYWQDYVDLFNEKNPSGDVVNSIWHHRIVAICVSMGIVVSAKRFWLGLYLGRQTFVQYSDKLAIVMKKILFISEVASLGRTFERQLKHSENTGKRSTITAASFGLNKERFEGLISTMSDDSTTGGGTQSEVGTEAPKRVIDPDDRHPLTGSLSSAQKARISQLLGQWEEPTIVQRDGSTEASVTELLQFRRALEYLNTSYPFSGSFGLADRRETTIESAQEVYDRLLIRSPDPVTLQFDVIALLGVKKDGTLDQDKLKDMIKLFRPDRDGSLECIDFVKAVDSVYKELRLLRASVANSSKIDRAFESIFNFMFYGVVICIILSQIGYDPLALFLSISGVILGFAFMIGSASSKYFEGLLFILVRRPFQIGDGISLSDVNEHTLEAGSPFWIVEDVDLFTTRVIYFKSSERATMNNGALANSRVINATLSTQAKLVVTLKFPVSVSYEKLQIFHQAVDQYFKNRPREWAAFLKFALVKVEADLGYGTVSNTECCLATVSLVLTLQFCVPTVQYVIIGRHRLPWVSFGELMQSKADLMHFSMELAKKLDIWYKNPPLPVDLSIASGNLNEVMRRAAEGDSSETQPLMHPSPETDNTLDLKELQTKFRPQLDWQR